MSEPCAHEQYRLTRLVVFSQVYRIRCSPQPRSRAILAVPAESELNGSLYIGFICLKELIGFPPEPCGGAGSLALRLGV